MTVPWYLTPAALAVIMAQEGEPDVFWHEVQYVITKDRIACFVGPAFDTLTELYERAFTRFDAKRPWPAREMEQFRVTPDMVLGAVFGDANGNNHFRTHRDESDEWAALRAEIAAALVDAEAAMLPRMRSAA